jgi:transcriptional regulator with XRE-family HTH domain
MSIARNIIAARENAGLSPDQLARKAAVSRSSVCEWELGHHEPRLPMLRKLAKILKVDLGRLIGGVL